VSGRVIRVAEPPQLTRPPIDEQIEVNPDIWPNIYLRTLSNYGPVTGDCYGCLADRFEGERRDLGKLQFEVVARTTPPWPSNPTTRGSNG
jgi:hypothetical protein